MATVVIPNKVCKICNKNIWYIRKSNRTGNDIYSCNTCIKNRKIKWRLDNKERVNSINRVYMHNNLEKKNIVQQNYRKKHPEKHRASAKKWRENNLEKWKQSIYNYQTMICETLADTYIKHNIQKLYFYNYGEKIDRESISQDIVDKHREGIFLFRKLKSAINN